MSHIEVFDITFFEILTIAILHTLILVSELHFCLRLVLKHFACVESARLRIVSGREFVVAILVLVDFLVVSLLKICLKI